MLKRIEKFFNRLLNPNYIPTEVMLQRCAERELLDKEIASIERSIDMSETFEHLVATRRHIESLSDKYPHIDIPKSVLLFKCYRKWVKIMRGGETILISR